MAVTAIPTSSAKCGTTTDTNVGLNPNTNANDKVQAFADAFSSAASTASSNCHNLPGKLILGLWGGESGWATGNTQKNNQNWANMTYTNDSNPPGNIGKGSNGWAKFCGRNTFATGFAGFLKNNSRYSDLIKYLKETSSPDANSCAKYIADAGYGGSDHKAYYDLLVGYMSTLCNRSDYC
ncbi:Mannosyl-glycoprotein endo-beta-N-acetylglucosaminidase [Paenibacillus uliginis N3/975]|uniref:Mannosyl-glycoprotein endo-beta-N-acetylglucosaminidase n=1 Tax=Paenibacillus uliginis N3/975 TaxID=1313296 RepID=A0A1X7H149_9BACL|nr:glucosaminidase domain-containing protein [Paenibacillus uliginis]SMF78016.1 Mannosyl-glycoprotein endo-beta-N-acetylglucosaminidase [Paenibacillus uliginis N3/975]